MRRLEPDRSLWVAQRIRVPVYISTPFLWSLPILTPSQPHGLETLYIDFPQIDCCLVNTSKQITMTYSCRIASGKHTQSQHGEECSNADMQDRNDGEKHHSHSRTATTSKLSQPGTRHFQHPGCPAVTAISIRHCPNPDPTDLVARRCRLFDAAELVGQRYVDRSVDRRHIR